MTLKEEIISLNARLTEASEAYYRKNQPIMGDAEFDALERRLKILVADNPLLATLAPIIFSVGSDASGGRVPHASPMLSIENQYEEKDLIEWYGNLPPTGIEVCVEPKFDGISVSLLYRDSRLVRALTRGDGKSGENITEQAYAVGAIPKLLKPPLPPDLEIRGELVMKNSTLARINLESEASGGKVYTSTRNLTGGTMKLKDTSLIPSREIEIRPWDVIGGGLPDSGLERLALLASSGFPPPLGIVVCDPDSLVTALRQKLKERTAVLRDQFSLETDGVVIKVDSHKQRRLLGFGSKYTNWQACFKPQSASGTTYLRSIEWQVGRTGKVSPVAVCDPVILAGAKVEHASLNNITWIRERGLKLGAKVEMLRSGDVIPQIVRVLDEGEGEILPPANCPECLTSLEESDEGGAGTLTHRCPNKGCPGRVRDTLTFIGSREVLEIDGLGPEMAARLVSGRHAADVGELYGFLKDTQSRISQYGEKAFMDMARLDGFDVTLLKMAKSLEAAKSASWERWIKALCIPMIGATLGKAIAAALELDGDDMVWLPDKLVNFAKTKMEGFGEAKLGAIITWANDPDNFQMCRTLHGLGVRPTPVGKPKVAAGAPLKDVIFCITGEFSEDREAITKKLVSLGASAKSSVSSKLNLLIVGESAGKTKLKKAEELGIKQVGKDWLIKTLSDNGLELFEAESA